MSLKDTIEPGTFLYYFRQRNNKFEKLIGQRQLGLIRNESKQGLAIH